jgi:hypothetical protein
MQRVVQIFMVGQRKSTGLKRGHMDKDSRDFKSQCGNGNLEV